MSKITVTTIAGQTSGSDANKVKIESGDTLEVVSNATVGGTTTLTGDLAVDTDTLFADVSADKVGINNSSPNHELQINGNSTTSSLALKTSATGNATSDGLELKVQGDSAAYLYNYENAMLRFGTNGLERVRIDADGQVTKPNQCYFSVGVPGNQNNISNSGYTTITFDSETFDIGNNFASNTFTAPVTGKYLFCLNMRLDNVDTAVSYYNIGINTSNRSHYQLFAPTFASDPPYYNFMKSVIVDMDANDTATVSIFQNGGTAQTDINSSTRWYGYLLG